MYTSCFCQCAKLISQSESVLFYGRGYFLTCHDVSSGFVVHTLYQLWKVCDMNNSKLTISNQLHVFGVWEASD